MRGNAEKPYSLPLVFHPMIFFDIIRIYDVRLVRTIKVRLDLVSLPYASLLYRPDADFIPLTVTAAIE